MFIIGILQTPITMRKPTWILACLQMTIYLCIIQAEEEYKTTSLNLHQGAIVRNRGNIMLGQHTLDIYLPVELKDYRDVLKRFFLFLQEAPTRLHLQILALKIMTKDELQTQEYQNQLQNETKLEKNFLYPVRNLHPILKAIYYGRKINRENNNAKLTDKWNKATTQNRKEWSTKIRCLEHKDQWLTNNWKSLVDSTQMTEDSTSKVPRCFQEETKNENSTIITSNESTLEDISITLLKKLQHIEVHYSNLNKIYGPPRRNRRKRGLVNIIGDVQKYLWGTATSEDVERVEHLVLKMKTGNTKILHALGSLEVVVQKQLDKTNFLMNQTRLLNSQLSHLAYDIISIMKGVSIIQNQLKVEQVLQTFTQILQQAALGLDVLERDITQFLTDLDKASSNLLSSTLITPDELRGITNSVCGKLPHGKRCNFGPQDATYFQLYQEITTEIIKLPQGEKCVKLQLAINDDSATMELIQVNKIPIPIEGKGEQYIQPRINENVLYAIQGEMGVEIMREKLNNCKKFYNTPNQCEETKYKLLSPEMLDCIQNIENRDSKCPTEIVHIQNPALFIKLGTGVGVYNFRKKKSVLLMCEEHDGKKKIYIPLHGYGKLIYRADCDLVVNETLYIGTHNLNSSHHFAIKQAPYEDVNIPYNKLPQLGLWSRINEETVYPSITDLKMIQQAAEKAAKEIDDEELEFEPIQQMLQNTRTLISEAAKDDNSLMWYDLVTYTDWTLIIIISIIVAVAMFIIIRKCRARKDNDLNRVVESFRKNLRQHLNDRKKKYKVKDDKPDETEAETIEMNPLNEA